MSTAEQTVADQQIQDQQAGQNIQQENLQDYVDKNQQDEQNQENQQQYIDDDRETEQVLQENELLRQKITIYEQRLILQNRLKELQQLLKIKTKHCNWFGFVLKVSLIVAVSFVGYNLYNGKITIFQPFSAAKQNQTIKYQLLNANKQQESRTITVNSGYIFNQNKQQIFFGNGTIMMEKGTYTGEIQNNLPHGIGRIKRTNGNTYEGKFSLGFADGQGINNYANGNVYNGQWAMNSWSGQGRFQYQNGDFIIGQFDFDQCNGKFQKQNQAYEGIVKFTNWGTGAFEITTAKGEKYAYDGKVLSKV